jgi:hypothetical protein
MKNLLLFFSILFITKITTAQQCDVLFHDSGIIYGTHKPNYSMDNIWQFGTTSKAAFQGEFEFVDGPFRMCTDTLYSINDTGRWEMYFGIDRDTMDFYNRCIEEVEFRAYKMKFEGVKDSTGLLLEVSPDSIRWFNVLSQEDVDEYHIYTGGRNLNISTSVFFDSIILLDGAPVWVPKPFWTESPGLYIRPDYTLSDAASLREMHFRLTYISKTFTEHAGVVMISPRLRIPVFCEFIDIEEKGNYGEITIYPNPVNECSIFQLSDKISFPVQLTIADPTGRILHKSKEHTKTIPVPELNLGTGLYLFSIKDANGYTTSGNFLVN